MKLGQLIKRVKGSEWLIPRYEQYLRGERDTQVEASHAAKIITRPARDRSVGWSASSAGRCQREQLLNSYRAPKEPYRDETLNIFENGHYVHLRHQVIGLSAGYLTDVEISVDLEEHNVKGTMDGKDTESIGTEFKSINNYGFGTITAFGPLEDHLMQVNAYMLASELEAFRILYENKNDNTMKEFYVSPSEEHIERNLLSWDTLNFHHKNRTLTPIRQDCKNMTGTVYKQCPYASVCLKIEDDPALLTQVTSSLDND